MASCSKTVGPGWVTRILGGCYAVATGIHCQGMLLVAEQANKMSDVDTCCLTCGDETTQRAKVSMADSSAAEGSRFRWSELPAAARSTYLPSTWPLTISALARPLPLASSATLRPNRK